MGDAPLFNNLFLGVGAMKSGTTWLYTVLEDHPELFFSYAKEIQYFYHRYENNTVLSEQKRLTAARKNFLTMSKKAGVSEVRNRMNWVSIYLDSPVDDTWYRNLFFLQGQQKYTCDFSNTYARLSEDAWKHVLVSTANLRVLYTMRNPIKRLWSHVKFHLQITGQTQLLNEWKPSEFRNFIRKPYIWENAEYGNVIRRMRKVLPAEVVKLAFFEDVRANPRAFLTDLEGFLDISNVDYPQSLLEKQINKSIPHSMPDFFPDLVAGDIERIIGEVKEEGLVPPASWAVT